MSAKREAFEAVSVFDSAVAEELPRVSHIEYDSHEICKHFAGKVRERMLAAAPAAQSTDYDDSVPPIWETLAAIVADVYGAAPPAPQPMAQRVKDLLARVPLPPKAITYEGGWSLLDELQAIAVLSAAQEQKP